MPSYKYNRDDYYKLLNLPCIDVALSLGMEINQKESSSKAYKIKGEQGLCIFREGNNWYRFSDGKGGYPIDLVQDKLGCDKEQALDYLAHYAGVSQQSTSSYSYKSAASPPPTHSEKHISEKEKREFIVPPHSIQPKRAMAYLIKTRGIDPEIVKTMIQRKMIAEDDAHHNCLFFGRDSSGEICSCCLRGTMTDKQFRGETAGGNKEISFAMQGRNRILRLFESPIDAMSHATFSKLLGRDWTADHRLSVNGSGCYDSIKRYLTDHPEVTSVWFSYDNDDGGHKGVNSSIPKLQQDFADRNLDIRVCYPPHGKDWNEDLQLFRQSQNLDIKDFLNLRPPPQVQEAAENYCDEPEP